MTQRPGKHHKIITYEGNPNNSKYVEAFTKFREVIKACFSDNLEADFELKIKQFEKCYRKLGLSEILKGNIHI